MSARRTLARLAGIAALQLLACSDDPLPQCPTGDCTLAGSTVVKFRFDEYPALGFDGDTCRDVGASFVRVELVSTTDPSVVAGHEVSCGDAQVTFLGLGPGAYAVAVTPLDAALVPIVAAPGVGEVTAAGRGAISEATVNVPYTAWAASYTGTLLFRVRWGGVSCEMAPQPITTQRLTLRARGVVVAGAVTDSGQRMDGVDARPCRLLSEQFPQFVERMPFGPASVRVVGLAGANVIYDHEVETFIGAGINNPTLTFVAPPDAAPDAPPDAPPAAPPDAPPAPM